MSQAATLTLDHHHDDGAQVKKIWRTFWLLSAITVVELGIGLSIYTIHKGAHANPTLVLMFKGIVCILTLAKAFYIVSIFMHLGDEIRNLVMTIIVPLMLFIWFIGSFLYEGNSWKNNRNTNVHTRPATEQVLPAEQKGVKD